jgi:hypothetical protein
MKKIAIYIFTILFLGLSFAEKGPAPDIKRADELFEKDAYQEALEVYEAVYKETSDTDTKGKAFFRVCECLVHLFRYGEAAQKLLSTPIPENRDIEKFPPSVFPLSKRGCDRGGG